MSTLQYVGPAGVHMSHEDLLLVWQALALSPTDENADLRDRVQRYLEARD